ncbi:MAG: hypothetical protein KC621_26840 [Myxococcales bacterium]|nr:hypothetical protein [Myxococcales bacterium]
MLGVGLGLWMTIEQGSGAVRMPADWIVREATPVSVPTADGLVDLRDVARDVLVGGEGTVEITDNGRAYVVRLGFE